MLLRVFIILLLSPLAFADGMGSDVDLAVIKGGKGEFYLSSSSPYKVLLLGREVNSQVSMDFMTVSCDEVDMSAMPDNLAIRYCFAQVSINQSRNLYFSRK